MSATWKAADSSYSAQVRERIVDAAERCFAEGRPGDVTIEDVASQAQYSRASVYRYFTKDQLLLAVLVRVVDRYAAELDVVLDDFDDPGDMVVEGLVRAIERIRSDPKLVGVFSGAATPLMAQIAAGSPDLFMVADRGMAPVMSRVSESLRPGVDVGQLTEWMVRIGLSLLTVAHRTTMTAEEERSFVRAILVPMLFPDTLAVRRAPISI